MRDSGQACQNDQQRHAGRPDRVSPVQNRRAAKRLICPVSGDSTMLASGALPATPAVQLPAGGNDATPPAVSRHDRASAVSHFAPRFRPVSGGRLPLRGGQVPEITGLYRTFSHFAPNPAHSAPVRTTGNVATATGDAIRPGGPPPATGNVATRSPRHPAGRTPRRPPRATTGRHGPRAAHGWAWGQGGWARAAQGAPQPEVPTHIRALTGLEFGC